MNSDLWTKIIMLILVLHFVAGFGYLMYKLSPKKEDKKEEDRNDLVK